MTTLLETVMMLDLPENGGVVELTTSSLCVGYKRACNRHINITSTRDKLIVSDLLKWRYKSRFAKLLYINHS